MKRTKHTPGPWKTENIGHPSLFPSVIIADGCKIVVNISHDRKNGSIEANAKLIAAAPELLSALKEMVRMYEKVQPSGGWQGQYEEALNAIKKATL